MLDRIRLALTNGEVTKAELAKEAGVNRGMLTDIHDENFSCQLAKLRALHAALDRITERNKAYIKLIQSMGSRDASQAEI